jgi:hypothetical protein
MIAGARIVAELSIIIKIFKYFITNYGNKIYFLKSNIICFYSVSESLLIIRISSNKHGLCSPLSN